MPPTLPPTFLTALPKDPLSIALGYLPDNEIIALRAAGNDVRLAADQAIESLLTTPVAFTSLLRDSQGLPNLHHVCFENWAKSDLIDFATAMHAKAYSGWHLTLKRTIMRYDLPDACADGIEILADLRLASLTLVNLSIKRHHAAALASAPYPINVTLSHDTADAAPAAQIPMLQNFDMRNLVPDIYSAEALSKCNTLRRLTINRCTDTVIRQIMSNRGITSLSLTSLVNFSANQHQQESWVTNHPALESLQLSRVRDPNVLVAVSRNPRIAKLVLKWPSSPCFPFLNKMADMPSLREMSIICEYANPANNAACLHVDQLSALCRKPLDSLTLIQPLMSSQMLELFATAACKRLVICARLSNVTPTSVVNFLQNHHIVALHLDLLGEYSHFEAPVAAAQIAAHPFLETLFIKFRSSTESAESIHDAWCAAGKRSIDLQVDILPPYFAASAPI